MRRINSTSQRVRRNETRLLGVQCEARRKETSFGKRALNKESVGGDGGEVMSFLPGSGWRGGGERGSRIVCGGT